jgi:thiosulfate/3-mercaptopyruvate sulfurtransferase
MHSPLISAEELAAQLAEPLPPLVLDVQFVLGDPAAGLARYEVSHIPGAIFCDLDTVLAGPVRATGGRHPLPDPTRLQRDLRALGLRDDSSIVAYDQGIGMGAARAWWVRRWVGHEEVVILDGGLPAWEASGGATESGPGRRRVDGDIHVDAGHMPLLDAEAAAAVARDGILLDARTATRYRGEAEPIDRVAGHIPGARSLPTADVLDASGRYLPPDELRRRFAASGVRRDRPVGTYCGSGVSAVQDVVALTIAGFESSLYAGSWSDWISDPDRPIAVGEE